MMNRFIFLCPECRSRISGGCLNACSSCHACRKRKSLDGSIMLDTESGDMWLSDGHCRIRAVQELFLEGLSLDEAMSPCLPDIVTGSRSEIKELRSGYKWIWWILPLSIWMTCFVVGWLQFKDGYASALWVLTVFLGTPVLIFVYVMMIIGMESRR